MRVTFTEFQYVYKGKYPEDSENGVPLIEKKPIAKHSGRVVDTIVMNAPDTLGNPISTPHFVVALDDGTFTIASIYDCTVSKDDEYFDD